MCCSIVRVLFSVARAVPLCFRLSHQNENEKEKEGGEGGRRTTTIQYRIEQHRIVYDLFLVHVPMTCDIALPTTVTVGVTGDWSLLIQLKVQLSEDTKFDTKVGRASIAIGKNNVYG